MYSKEVAPDRRTLRTVLRDTFSARTISLIDLPRTKCSRLIRPIVSTTSIPRHPLASPSGSACTSLRKGGSKLDADHPSTGVNLPRRNTLSVPHGQLSVPPAGRAPGQRPQPPIPLSPPPTSSPTAWRLSRRRGR